MGNTSSGRNTDGGTKVGGIETILSLMAEEVVFLLPGQPPMVGKSAFAAAAQAQSTQSAPQFDGTSEIQEINILGEWAFMWTNYRSQLLRPKALPQ